MKIIGALLFAAIAAWGCGAPSAIPPAPCNPSCGVGQSCIAGRCFVEVDSSTDAAPDASTDDRSISDTAPDAASEDAADAELDAVVCETTFRDCDRNPANGCEADTQNSRIHCGGCGSSCLMGEVCIRGGCVRPPPPDASADAQCSSFTIANCCGISCTTGAHASAATCSSSGRCGLVCESGFADCDGSVANGCEANLASSTQHCSACGAPCATRPTWCAMRRHRR